MLHTAAGLFRQQGYAATGLNQVLAESQAPKGSLYFHFPGGKEQLATEAVALSGTEFGARLAAELAAAPGVAAGIDAVGELLARTLEESDFREGCPVATVALDAAADSAPIREACDGTYEAWLAGLAGYLERHGAPAATSAPTAALVLSALQGALLLARVRRDAAVVRSVADQVARCAAAMTITTGDNA